MTLILSRKDVMSVLEMKDCMTVVEKAFAELSNGTAVLPLRIPITPPNGLALYMPAYLKESKALACKVVTVFKNNPANYNMPVTIGKVLLQDPDTGDVICIMDGGYLTAVRTGAVSGVATKLLARPDENQIAGIFGTGVQARMQLWAVAEARKLSKAIVFDLNKESADKFAADMSAKLGIPVIVAENPDELMVADIICAATSASTPIFDGSKVKAGAHINGIGSHTPNARELDTEIIRRSKFVGDSREACFSEAGDIIIPVKEGAVSESHYYADLGDIITGKKPARENNTEITLFKSNGLAIQDVATAKLVYEMAVQKGIGVQVEI
ncbi:MAG: ornithine cyclodeaminase family protein [Bacteroidetes bacterium]|nr:ornithine cyclodeaminase family protein [Bacteroidota bacterium]MBU1720997.1 ornithine cyclodeaminase family protein [Bacteroidota bacterium]